MTAKQDRAALKNTSHYGHLLLDAGLIQFGRFENGVPVRFALELLPSYPHILQTLADAVSNILTTTTLSTERVICTPDATAIGIAVSLKTGIPLVYSRGQGQPPVHDLVGAYDVGHPTALITSVIGRHTHHDLERFGQRAATVGLNIMETVGFIGLHSIDEACVHTLIDLPDFVSSLCKSGGISNEVANYLLGWLKD